MSSKVSLLGAGCSKVGIFPATLPVVTDSVGPLSVRRDQSVAVINQVVIELYRYGD